ncbi:MAG: methionine--tRNA ligase subunit beta [Conexivisphaerales archaeon]
MEATKDDFEKLNILIGRILNVSEIPNSNKLLKLEISLGDKKKTILSGIKKWYKKEDLIGKEVVVLENIKPAKMAGELSEGMILAASDGENLSILTVDREIREGAKVS